VDESDRVTTGRFFAPGEFQHEEKTENRRQNSLRLLLPLFLLLPFLAQTTQDQTAQADRLLKQGIEQFQTSQYEAALQSWEQALAIYRRLQDRKGEAKALNNLGEAYRSLSQYERAIASYQQALPIFQQVKDRNGEAKALMNLGLAYDSLSQYERAIASYQQALPIYQQVKDRNGEADLLHNLGLVSEGQNQSEVAIEFYKQSVNVQETIRQGLRSLPRDVQESHTQSVAGTYRRLANLLTKQGETREAQQVLELLKR
jgi:tetratricopeptide (TPR) repeat protein